ncbi:MAG: trans-aconitate 2-methyltransferase [Neisseria sp.]|nr:trans-aconitate 2-methyltransferase [Neisseria sp.]
MSDWNPQHYLAFADERTRPAADLLARIADKAAKRITDLGCGPANSTALLVQNWPQASVCGVDNSAAMIAEARKALPQAQFVQEDFSRWQADAAQDVIFANASLQWAGGHEALLPKLISQLAPEGVLAIQMPDNLNEPSHRLMRETAESPEWASRFNAAAVRPKMPSAAEYYDIFARAGCRADIWRTTYYHALPDAGAIVHWFGSTALRPYLDALPESSREAFIADYLARLREAYPPRTDGKILLALPRLFIVAERI